MLAGVFPFLLHSSNVLSKQALTDTHTHTLSGIKLQMKEKANQQEERFEGKTLNCRRGSNEW